MARRKRAWPGENPVACRICRLRLPMASVYEHVASEHPDWIMQLGPPAHGTLPSPGIEAYGFQRPPAKTKSTPTKKRSRGKAGKAAVSGTKPPCAAGRSTPGTS